MSTKYWQWCCECLMAVIVVSGCQSATSTSAMPAIRFLEDPIEMKGEILELVPVGTSLVIAKTRMEAQGFECSLDQEEHGPILFCMIQKAMEFPTGCKWQVIFDYADGEVTDVRVYSGIVAP